jgi:hypothetical protein
MASRLSYKFKAHPTGDQKLPPQAIIVLKTLEALGQDGEDQKFVTRDALVAELDKVDGDRPNKLNARQPVERVVMFYQKRLIDEGFIEMDKPATEPKEKKAKAAKEPKATKSKVPAAPTAEEAAETAESMAM